MRGTLAFWKASWTFNGAASCGTRKVAEIFRIVARKFPLQWGRVLWDAERVTRLPARANILGLQWGRVLWDAESGSSTILLTNDTFFLQWGRVLWDAESIVGSTETSVHDLPSMGPRLVGRGKVRPEDRPAGASVPSMGPRLVGRGKIASPRPAGVVASLQWGRVLWDAERMALRISANPA